MKSLPDLLIAGAAIAGILACLGDVAIPVVLGRMVPGYDSTRDVLSKLGTAESPVRSWINAWWCVFGLLFVVFAGGYYRAFAQGAPLSSAGFATLLLVIFGLGAGPGAGLFPMDVPGTGPTRSGSLHSWLSGAGFAAMFFIPLLGLGVFGEGRAPALVWLSIAAQLGGIACAVLIFVAERPGASGWLALGGLWQRALLVNYYLYFIALAVVMLRAGRVA